MILDLFQSTSSVRRTTAAFAPLPSGRPISIHVLRAEDDHASKTASYVKYDFNPRPPCGGRPIDVSVTNPLSRFQSTSSVRRTTEGRMTTGSYEKISIHVLRAEDDGMRFGGCRRPGYFNPRPPCGGRLNDLRPPYDYNVFQSTSSVRRTT